MAVAGATRAAVIRAMGDAPRVTAVGVRQVMAADALRALAAVIQRRAATGADLHMAVVAGHTAAEATAAIAKRNSGASLKAI